MWGQQQGKGKWLWKTQCLLGVFPRVLSLDHIGDLFPAPEETWHQVLQHLGSLLSIQQWIVIYPSSLCQDSLSFYFIILFYFPPPSFLLLHILSVLPNLAVLNEIRWNLKAVYICIPLIPKYPEHILKMFSGAEKMVQRLRLLFQRTPIQFPALAQQLTTL